MPCPGTSGGTLSTFCIHRECPYGSERSAAILPVGRGGRGDDEAGICQVWVYGKDVS